MLDEFSDEKNLVDWSNPPTLSELKRDLELALPDHNNHVAAIIRWLDHLKGVGEAKVKTNEGRSQYVPKLIRKQLEWRIPALTEPFLGTPELFNISPVTFEDRKSAIKNSMVLNNQFNTKLKKVNFIDEYIRTLCEEGTVIVRTGWETETKEITKAVPVYQYYANPEMIEVIKQVEGIKNSNPLAFTELPIELQEAYNYYTETGEITEAVIVDYTEVTEDKVIKNQPTVHVCEYNSVIIDPTCKGDLDNASFIIYKYETSLSDLRKAGYYKNLDRINTESSSPLNDNPHQPSTSFTFSDKARKKLEAYEYWGYYDYNGTGTAEPFVATWVNDTLIRLEESPFPDGKLPFTSATYLPVRKSIYGEPDAELLIDNQKISGAVQRGMIDIMARISSGQIGYRKGTLDYTNKRRFRAGQDYEYNGNVSPNDLFHVNKFPEIPVSAQYMLNLQNAEAESLSGVKGFSGTGISGTALGDNVGGIRSALDAVSKREINILRRAAEGIIEIGRKIIAMNSIFLSEEEVVRITNETFEVVRRDDLRGDFDLQLSISTPEADNEKAQNLSFMLQTIGNTMPQDITRELLADIADLRKLPDTANRIRNYTPEPDPMQQQMAQLEIEERKAKVQKLYAEAQAAMATAKVRSSDADLKDLTFVEQETGTQHEREVAKSKAQAQGNMELEVLKHTLNKVNPNA